MNRARSGEEVAALYRRHVAMVYQICLMLMKNVPDAEDATQTVFRKVMEYDKPFRDPEHEKAWLIITARNECRDQLKHWWRRNRESEEALQRMRCEEPREDELKGADLGPARAGPSGAVSPLLSGVYRPGNCGALEEKSLHGSYLAGPGTAKAEIENGGGRT